MLRKFLDYQLSLTEEGKPLHKLRPLIEAGDTFLYEAPINTEKAPHIRDAIDIKRWMMIVVIALIPCILTAIWFTGLQSWVYSSGDYRLMAEYLESLNSWAGYKEFIFKNDRYLTIIGTGLKILVPIAIISYAAGGIAESLFATFRGHSISEGFLVSGILYALILPPTIPYWMVAVGVIVGIVLSKEVFGGSGMNIMNPALCCRAFLFFAYPGRMSGNVWVGDSAVAVRESLAKMNQEGGLESIDGITQATRLAIFNVPTDIKRIHVDAIATNNVGNEVPTFGAIEKQFSAWKDLGNQGELTRLSGEELRTFVTSPLADGGLGLSSGYYEDAYQFSALDNGIGPLNSDWNFFFGNKLGSLGETSFIACLIGAIILIWTGVGSWRTMSAMFLGGYATALLFEWGSKLLGADGGAFLPATFGFPAYKHLLLGGFAFGAVFMATDPVSSPSMKLGKWIYGIFCGLVAIVIRVINPAYPEGVMLAILMGNVFTPLIDYYVALNYAKRRRKNVRASA